MMNWKGFGRKWSRPNFKVLSWHLLGEIEENHEKPPSGQPIASAENQTLDLPDMKYGC
jgi:hypothetical protein